MFDAIIVANGKSLRAQTDKLAAKHGEGTVLARTLSVFRGHPAIGNVILVTDAAYDFGDDVIKVPGGETRAESVRAGLSQATSEYVLVHDGARPFLSPALLQKIMDDALLFGSSVPYLPVTDSLRKKENDKAIVVDRSQFFTVQTPQCFPRKELLAAYAKATEDDLLFDDSELFGKYVSPVHYTEGETRNKKITSPFDVFGYNGKAGVGYDLHPLAENGRPLVLGGVRIPYKKGPVAHSDGDVVLHAVMDALLSAANERDIGVLFPDSDPQYKNVDSALLLDTVKEILDQKGLLINNVAITIIAQKPKLSGHIPLMQNRIAEILSVSAEKININATTTERLGVIGQGDAIAVIAMASVY